MKKVASCIMISLLLLSSIMLTGCSSGNSSGSSEAKEIQVDKETLESLQDKFVHYQVTGNGMTISEHSMISKPKDIPYINICIELVDHDTDACYISVENTDNRVHRLSLSSRMCLAYDTHDKNESSYDFDFVNEVKDDITVNKNSIQYYKIDFQGKLCKDTHDIYVHITDYTDKETYEPNERVCEEYFPECNFNILQEYLPEEAVESFNDTEYASLFYTEADLEDTSVE